MAERVPVNDDPTIGKLVGDVSNDVSSLIRSEIALAKTELKFSAKAGGVGLGLFAAAAFLLVLAVIMLSVAIAYFINFTGLDLAWCFLIVFGFYALVAAVLGLIGYRSVRKVRGPEASIEQLKETKAVLKRG
jgi:Putative Actinobacterial Holin-X, holin superfamily III